LKSAVNIETVHQFIVDELDGVVPQNSWGESAYFYNPDNVLKRGAYFATLKEKDGENDRASNLNREGVWRLNIGVRKSTFSQIFGVSPGRPSKGEIIKGPWDFELKDNLTPHPIYGWMSWLAVNNPSFETFEKCKPLLIDAHLRAKATFLKRTKLR